MKQTPEINICNYNLLNVMPSSAKSIIEIGCMSGALAREYKKINTYCTYHGIDIVPEYAEKAKMFCDSSQQFDLENADEEFYTSHSDKDCWVFGDVLEHLSDPWTVLSEIRKVIPANGCVVASIPNAACIQMFARLALGIFEYEENGIFDKTHLRWFTRSAIVKLFESCGYEIQYIAANSFGGEGDKVINENSQLLEAIGELARLSGGDSNSAIEAARVCQYSLRAVPA